MVIPANQTTLTWTTTGIPDSCSATSSAWSGSKSLSGGSEVKSGLAVGTYIYQITCLKAGYPDAISSVTVTVTNVISGNIQYQCLDTRTWHPWPTPVDYHQGNGNWVFTFDNPLPANVTLNVAACDDQPLPGSTGGFTDNCWNAALIPSMPSGYISSSPNSAMPINLSQGATSYTTANPWLSASDGSVFCTEWDGKRNRRGRLTRAKYIYLKVTSSTPYVLNFRGQSLELGQDPQYINVTQVP